MLHWLRKAIVTCTPPNSIHCLIGGECVTYHGSKLNNSSALMFRIKHKYCLISTSYLAGYVCFGDFLPMRTLCDVHLRNLNLISIQSWTYLLTPQGNNNLNFALAHDQVVHLKTAANLCASRPNAKSH